MEMCCLNARGAFAGFGTGRRIGNSAPGVGERFMGGKMKAKPLLETEKECFICEKEPMEIWKDLKGYEGKYRVSNKGRVSNYKRILTPTDNGNGYLIIGLCKDGKKKNFYIHRLVAGAFIDNPKNKPVVNHRDYNTKNNNAENLEWATQKENVIYSKNNMRHRKSITQTNTGERYISYRKSKATYRVTVDRKEYGTYKTLQEAVVRRDEILKGVI